MKNFISHKARTGLLFLLFGLLTQNGWGQVSLPVSRTSWATEPTGWTNSGCTQRTSTFACSGSDATTFDTNNDSRVVNFSGVPYQLNFALKKSSMSGQSKLTVEESANGTSYSLLGVYGTATAATAITDCGNITLNILSTTRYIRWTYTKATGNCDMDDVSITSATPSAPTIGTITPGNQQLSVAFTTPISNGGSAITNYKYSTDGGTSFLTRQTGTTATPIVITTLSSDGTTALTNGTSYNVQIRAVNANGDGAATASTAATPRTTPSAPTIGTITPGNSQLSVAFTAGSDGGASITDYKWSVDGTNYTTRAGTASPIVITGLANGTAYTVRIRAVNAAGDGSVATAGSTSTPRTTPSAPTIGTITPGNGQLSVAFTAGSDGGASITDYKWSVDGTNYTTRAGTGSPIVITGLTNGTAYTVRIRAVNAAGDGSVATASAAATPVTSPSAPTITSITPGDALLSVAFTAPSSNGGVSISNYEYSTDGGTNWTTPSPGVTTSPLLITGLTNDTTYNVQIRAVNSAGSGTASTAVQGTPTAPTTPTIFGAATATAFTTTYGTASAAQSFAISGSSLDADIIATAPTGFEVSSDGTNYGTTTTFFQSGGTASGTLRIRLKAGATVTGTNYNNVTIQLTSTNATTVNITTASSGNSVATKALTITGISISNKVYDGNTTATILGTAIYSGLVSGDNSTVTDSPTAVFADKTVANAKAVTVSGYTAPSANYSITQPTGLTANITAAPLTLTSTSVTTKTYDGTTAATITGTLSGIIPSDVVTLNGTGTFASANAGIGISVTSTSTLGGADAGNYALTQPTGLTGDITKANQTITFNALVNQTIGAADYSPGATSATSGTNAITYTSSNTAVATITAGSLIQIVGAGTTTITASQAASTNYNAAADVIQSLTVTLAPITLATWNFTTNVSPASVPLNVTISNLAQGNNNGTTTILSATSASSGYSGASGTNNAGAAARAGVLSTGANGSAYFEFTITPTSGYYFSLKGISFGSRGTSTAPVAYVLRSSVDSYGSDLVTGSLSVNSTWGLYSNSTINSISSVGSAITYRIYGYNGTGSPSVNTANWRIDDLTLSGNVILAATPPTLTADATANTVDNNIDITFTDDTAWRNAITAVKIGSTALTLTTDYVISAGNIQLKPSGANVLLTASGSKSITVVATGYSDATVTQEINAGAPTANSTATISAILAPNVTRTVTCTAKDQYSNSVPGYTFKYDATITSDDATTSESYTIDASAITSTTNNVSLTSTTNSSGVATFTVVMPAVLDANDGLSLQVQLVDGTTNIGSTFAYHELPGQTITFGTLSAVTYGDAAFTLSATGGASGNPVTFTSSDPLVATCTGTNGTTLTITGAGTVTIYANQAASASYNAAAQESQSLVVNQKGLTISGLTGVSRVYNGTIAATFTGTPAYVGLAYGQSFSVSGTASAVFSDADVGTGKTITISGYTVPSDNYTLTQPTLTADITQASQTISFGSLPNRVVGGASFTLPLNASSTLAISYASSDINVATVSGNTVTIVGVGTTTITASQAGNSNYFAATSVSQDQTIIATPIAGWDFFGQNNIASLAATTLNSNLTSGGITRGAGASANSAANSFSTTGFQNDGISTANTDYFQITLTPGTGYQTSLSVINANFDGTASFYGSPGVTSQYAYSLDGTNFTLIGSAVTSVSLKPAAVDLTGISALQNVTAGTTITIRYYASGQTTTGGWRFSSPAAGILGLAIGGSVDLIPTNNWTGGNSTWDSTSNWSLSRVPLSTDNITISTGSPVLNVSHTIDAGRTLTISGTGTLTINPNAILTIAGTADFGGKSVIIKSDVSGDGAIGQVTGTLSNATSVTVERYIPAKRAWRALTSPLKGSDTSLFASWQNAGVAVDPFNTGIELWGPGGTGAAVDGNGLTDGPGYSIKKYTSTGWANVTNTRTTTDYLFTSSANNAYMVFVTGGYGSNNIGNGQSAATTLKATGELITGTVNYSLSSTNHTLIGNPFASPISPAAILSNTANTNTALLFPYLWVWNPAYNTNGAYELYDKVAGTYSGGNLSAGTAIQSGQAFFVRTETASSSLTLTESMKSSSISNTFRNSNSVSPSIVRASFLKQTALDWMPVDGCIAAFYEGANAAADDADGKKMINSGENIGFVRNTVNLSSEHYPLVTNQDILNLKIWNTQQARYKLKLNTEEFTMVGVEAY
ncbi:MAG: beta strand repeat-containing protein, partial [Flavobacterium sp.]